MHASIRLWTIFLLLLALPALASAQATAEPAPEAVTVEELDATITLLEDEVRRDALLADLRRLREAQAATDAGEVEEPSLGALLVQSLSLPARTASAQVTALTRELSAVPGYAVTLQRFVLAPGNRSVLVEIATRLLIILALAFAAEWVLRWLVGRAPELSPGAALGERVLAFTMALVREGLPIIAFGMVAYVVATFLDLRETTRLVAIAAINARLLVSFVLSVVRLLLDPSGTGVRPVGRFGDEDSAYLYVWARRLVAPPVYGYFAIEAGRLVGLPSDVHAPLFTLIGLYLTGLLIVLVLQSRRPVADWLAGNGDDQPHRPTLLRRLAGIWHLVAIFYLVAVFGVTSFGEGADAGFLLRATLVSLLVIVLFRYVNDGARRLLRMALRIPEELRVRFPTLEDRAQRYEVLLRRLLTFVLTVVGASIALQGWGVDVGAALTSETGQALISRSLLLLLIVGAVFLVWEGFSVVIESLLAERDPNGEPRERSARLLTLLPLLMNTVRLILTLLLVLTVLSELGVDIAPLLAGAGVLGIAVGFGAQSLVRDVITGVFILLEETISVGDIVTLGAHTGVVEKMTIRTIRLRDVSGNVHTLPYGDVSVILNYSEEFAYALLDVGVAYRENTDEVVEVLKMIAAEFATDPEYMPDLAGEFEVMGVNELADSSVTIRVRQRTEPGKQFRVRRELLRRIKLRFDELGIEIPFPHTTLYFGADKDGSAPPAHVAMPGGTEPGGV